MTVDDLIEETWLLLDADGLPERIRAWWGEPVPTPRAGESVQLRYAGREAIPDWVESFASRLGTLPRDAFAEWIRRIAAESNTDIVRREQLHLLNRWLVAQPAYLNAIQLLHSRTS